MINDDIVPEGWVLTTVEDVVYLNPPKPPKDLLPPKAQVTFVPMSAVDANLGAIAQKEKRPFSAVYKGYTAFKENDVIMAKITPCMENGKAAIARGLENGLGFGSTEFHVVRSRGAILPEFVYYFIRQESFRKEAEGEMTGSVGQKRVPADFLRNSEILVPPLAEQKRIVKKVEELIERVNAVKKRLAKASEILKRFRQCILAAACSGHLTISWRQDKNNVKKNRHMPEGQTKNRMGGSADNGEEDLPTVPEEWKWVTIGQVGKVITGSTPSKKEIKYFKGPIPFFKPTDLNAGYHVITSNDSLTEEGGHVARKLPPFTIMVTCIGATIGKTGLSRVAGATNQQINSIVSNPDSAFPNWIFWVFNWPWLQEQIKMSASETTLPILNKSRFENLLIPLPPIDEQKEIVSRVDALFNLADSIEKRVLTATIRVEKLTQAILAKAFRGELVPSEAELARREGRAYETASDLLARIKSANDEKRRK